MSRYDEYAQLVRQFREITREVHQSTGRCCADVRDGVPKCCYSLIDGEELTFTPTEVNLLVTGGVVSQRAFVGYGGVYALDRQFWFGPFLEQALATGWLADTLECGSHPTRPIVLGRTVVGVAVVPDCNTPVAMPRYIAERRHLMGLWQKAIDLTGLKPYYVTSYIDDGLIVL